MKSILFVLFLGFGMSAFAANTATKNHLSLELNTVILKDDFLQKANKSDKNEVTYQSYYAFEWLYRDSPFIKKLIVLA
ncbi:hypothetical protein [Aquimarina agarivorans]|uniref:hypothetical protein n=1 Tax=Aquimarina agarivorans TaxID=980584 RepID=UPI0011106996|nr:hypothetical protein [Aquimarina agarivorans]